MQGISTVIESNTIATLLGVGLGFVLSGAQTWFSDIRKRQRAKKNLKRELESAQAQIKEKMRAILNVIENLEKRNFLDPKTVHVNCMVYKSSIKDLYEEMDVASLNCLHAIYERIRLAEDVLDNFKSDFLTISSQDDRDPSVFGKGRLKDVRESYEVTLKLIGSFLKKKPIDVYYMGS